MYAWFKKKKLTINDQLNNLQSVGIRLKDHINLEEYLDFEKRDYEEKPYFLLLMELGSEIQIENNAFVSASNDVWYFDTECIEGHGDYVRVIERIRELIKAEIEIDNINDYVDIEEEVVNITFTVNGNGYKYDLGINDDWIDKEIFRIFSMLLMEYGSKRDFYSEIDQSLLLVLVEKEQNINLNKLLNIFIPAYLEEK